MKKIILFFPLISLLVVFFIFKRDFIFNFLLFFKKEKVSQVRILVDCSTSVDRDLFKKEILKAGEYWVDNSKENGKIEISIIGSDIGNIASFFSKSYPSESKFSHPVTPVKEKWKEDFIKELKKALDNLPSNPNGSGILESIFRASQILNEVSEHNILLIFSDMREVNSEWNFEKEVPEFKEFKKWAEEQHLIPEFKPNTKIIICGFKPYPSNKDTTKITSTDYFNIRQVWTSLFKDWHIKAYFFEEFNPKTWEEVIRNEKSKLIISSWRQ